MLRQTPTNVFRERVARSGHGSHETPARNSAELEGRPIQDHLGLDESNTSTQGVADD
jgi:hypothetical protein